MSQLDQRLSQRLHILEQQHLRRRLVPSLPDPASAVRVRRGDRTFLNFASNDYLGLSRDPELAASLSEASRTLGAGSTASRLVCGSLEAHHALETDLASWKKNPAALSFSSGYATAAGTIPALIGPGDVVVLDRLAHACLVDAAHLSGARLRVFRHNDVEDLRRILEWTRSIPPRAGSDTASPAVLVVTESVFSMDGDRAPLASLVEVKDEFGAWLMVDEAHGTGVIGPDRGGVLNELGLEGRVEVTMGTMGKALGCSGGFITGSATLCDYLVNSARSFLFSTAPPPGVAVAARTAVAKVRGPKGQQLQATLWSRVGQLHRGLQELGWNPKPAVSPILPLVVGSEANALQLAEALAHAGILAPAIRYPTVKRGEARIRITVSAAHAEEDVDCLLRALRSAMEKTGIHPD